jgi:O-antigen/teichoic acid export membrane protein
MSSTSERVAAEPPEPLPATVAGDKELRGMARGSAVNLVGAACTAVANFGLMVVVTHGFSRAEAGIFFSATSLFLLLMAVGQLGTGTGLVYFISRARALGDVRMLSVYLRTASVPVLAFSLAMSVALVAFAPQVADLTTDGDPGHLAGYLRVLGLFLPVACLCQVALSATRGLKTMRPSAYVDHIARPVLQLALVGGVAIVASANLLALAWVVPYLPALILVWLAWRRQHARIMQRSEQDTDTTAAPPPGTAGRFWKFTSPRALALSGQMAMQRVDIVLVAALRGPVEAAVYAAATRFLVLGQLGNQAVATAVQPRIGGALARNDDALGRRLYGTSTAWLILITWPVYLMFAAFGPFLLSVFGSGYRAGAPALLLLSLAMLVATGCGMVDMVLNMAGRTTWTLANTMFAVILMLGLDLWLIPELGVLGAAIGWSVSRTLANLVPLTLLGVTMRIHPFGRPFAAAVAAAVACYAVLPLLGRVVWGPTWTGVLVSGVLATACYLVVLWRLRAPLELAALTALRRRRG